MGLDIVYVSIIAWNCVWELVDGEETKGGWGMLTGFGVSFEKV